MTTAPSLLLEPPGPQKYVFQIIADEVKLFAKTRAGHT